MDTEIINYAKSKKLIITEAALTLLDSNNYKQIIDKLAEQEKIFVSPEDIKKEMITTPDNKPYIKHFRIMEEYSLKNKNYSQGTVEDFHKLFLDKYNTLSGIIKQRIDFEHTTIADAKKLTKNKQVDIIGMVYEKKYSKNGNLILTVDDPTGKINLVILKNQKNFEEYNSILLDNVLGFKCTILSQDMFIVNEALYPDMPTTKIKSDLKDDIYLAAIADTHVGSKLFLEKEFIKFIDWINGTDGDTEIVKNIKYLIIAGDLVDGIGVYPSQYEELAIQDIFKQYELFEEYILQIPKDIEIFIIPGNHDAVRLSDPQPPIPEMLLPRLSKQKNIHLLGSPAWVDIEGYKTLIYHGAALHGIYSTIKDIPMSKPDLAIKEILKRRDLMPQFGSKQTFIPMEKNLLTINEVPNIYIGGDVHHHAYGIYKECHIINTSCWQSITKYQIEQGHMPTYSKIMLFNLKTQKMIQKDFHLETEEI